MSKPKPKKTPSPASLPTIAANVLITPGQRKALEALKIEKQRSFGFLIREAIDQYLAAVKKRP